jgi:hypothetical protein
MAAVRVMAKDLVRTRQHISKFTVMKSNLQSLSLQMQVRVWSCRVCRAACAARCCWRDRRERLVS